MKIKSAWPMGLMLAGAFALSACSSDDGGSTASSTIIDGIALAPGGQVAMFENQTLWLATLDTLIPTASAEITGLDPVGGATVELIRIDNDGNQVGEALASTVTSVTGDYSLALPVGVDFSGDLVVRITGNSGLSMSAMVVEQSVDITPLSEFVLQKFIEDGTALADLAVNEVVALHGYVEEFDLTATADMTTMLAQLEAEVGTFVENQITVINSVEGDGTLVAGRWQVLELDFGFHDTDSGGWATFAMDSLTEDIGIADAGSGAITFTFDGTLDEAWTNYSVDDMGGAYIYHETSVGTEGDSLTGSVDIDGNMFITWPFEEDLETVDIGGANDPEGDGPDYGWRWPPGQILFTANGSGNVAFASLLEAGIRYGTTDTDLDGVKDAIDPSAKEGDEAFVGLLVAMKHGSGMGAGSLSGDYGLVSIDSVVDTAPYSDVDAEVGVVNFDGINAATVAPNAFNSVTYTRTPGAFPAVNISRLAETDATGFGASYSVSATGHLTLDLGIDGIEEGQVSADGKLIAMVDPETIDDGGNPATITNSSHLITLLTKLGNSAPTVAGSSYKLFSLIMEADADGSSALIAFSPDSSLVFNADGSATLNVQETGIERANDLGQNTAIVDTLGTVQFAAGSVSIAANGALDMSVSGADNVDIDGFVSADADVILMRVDAEASDNTTGVLGIMVGVKQ